MLHLIRRQRKVNLYHRFTGIPISMHLELKMKGERIYSLNNKIKKSLFVFDIFKFYTFSFHTPYTYYFLEVFITL